MWCDILVSAAGIIHNDGRCNSLVAGLQKWQFNLDDREQNVS